MLRCSRYSTRAIAVLLFFATTRGGVTVQDQVVDADDVALGDALRPGLKMESSFMGYREDLRRFLRRRLSSDADVDDCVQDTFLRVWRRAVSGELRENIRGYIFTTALNIARDNHRRSAVRRSVDIDEVADNTEALRTTERESDFSWREGLHLVEGELAKLKPSTRRVFLMHHVDHLTVPEIAGRLGTSTRTVERELARALDRLKTVLGAVFHDLAVD